MVDVPIFVIAATTYNFRVPVPATTYNTVVAVVVVAAEWSMSFPKFGAIWP